MSMKQSKQVLRGLWRIYLEAKICDVSAHLYQDWMVVWKNFQMLSINSQVLKDEKEIQLHLWLIQRLY